MIFSDNAVEGKGPVLVTSAPISIPPAQRYRGFGNLHRMMRPYHLGVPGWTQDLRGSPMGVEFERIKASTALGIY